MAGNYEGIGAAAGRGLGGFGFLVGQNLAERRMAHKLNPMRQALLDSQPYGGPMASLDSQAAAQQAQASYTPEQLVIMRAAQDPRLFARLAGSPAGALQLAAQLQPPINESSSIAHAGTPLGNELGLMGAESAEVKTKTQRGKIVSRDIQGFHTTKDNTIGGDKPMFGEGDKGRSLEYMTTLTPGFAKAQLTPEEENKFLTSVTNVTQPTQYKDPDTGLLIVKRPELPKYVQDALQMRGYRYSQDTGLLPPVARPRNPADAQAGQATSAASPTLGGNAITPPDSTMPTLFELAGSGKLTGPVPELGRYLDRMPMFGGNIAPEQTSMKTFTEGLLNRYVNALRMNPRYAQTEANKIEKEVINLQPATWDNAQNYQSRVVGFDDLLKTIEDQSREVVEGKRALVTGETRQHAMDTLQATQAARKTLLPSRLNSVDEAKEFIRTHAPGEKFMAKDKNGQWVVFSVPQRNQ